MKEKERIQAEICKEISGMSLEEEIAFYNQESSNKKLESWIAKVKQRSAARGKLKKVI